MLLLADLLQRLLQAGVLLLQVVQLHFLLNQLRLGQGQASSEALHFFLGVGEFSEKRIEALLVKLECGGSVGKESRVKVP